FFDAEKHTTHYLRRVVAARIKRNRRPVRGSYPGLSSVRRTSSWPAPSWPVGRVWRRRASVFAFDRSFQATAVARKNRREVARRSGTAWPSFRRSACPFL